MSAEEKIGRRVLSVFTAPLAQSLPDTMKLLNAAEAQLASKELQGGWNNVANSCRDALVGFARELHSLMQGTIPAEIKQGDLKNTIRTLLRSQGEDDRYTSTLSDLVDALWNHIGNLVHRPHSNKDDAERCFIVTVLTITEVLTALRKR